MTVHNERIPEAITAKLTRLLKRFKRVLLLKGLTVTLAVFLGAMLAALAIDRLFVIQHVSVRALISLTAFAVTVITACIFWVRPHLRRPRDVDLAATVEVAHPELEERVSSTIEFVIREDPPEFRGSEEMIHAVARQAEVSVGSVNFAGVVSAERARKSTALAVFLLLVTLCVAGLWWTDFSQLFKRFTMPWANIARVSSTHIRVHEPGDKLVAKGESVHIAATVTPKSVREATLYVEVEPDRWMSVKMTAAQPGSFSHRLADVTDDMRYYIRAGDGMTQRYGITVVERPRLERIDLRYDYPEYTGLTLKEELNAPGDIRAVVGTEVALTVTCSKPVDVARLEMTGLSRPMQMLPVGRRQFEARFTLTANGLYVPRFEDQYGFDNPDEEVRQIIADPDAPPVVQITRPERNIKLHAAGRLPVAIDVKDDFGVMDLALVYHVNELEPSELSVPFKSPGTPQVSTAARWHLAALKLKPGDMITYRARATDNRPGASPNVGYSATHTILITSPLSDVDKQLRQEQIARIKRAMAKLKEQLVEARRRLERMKKSAVEKTPLEAWNEDYKKAAKERLEESKPLAEELTKMLERDPLLDVLTPKAQEIEKKHIPEAAKATEKVQTNLPLEHSEKPIAKAESEVDEAIRKIDEMADEVKRLEKAEEDERKIAELADREDKLADEAEKVTPEQLEQLKGLAEDQDVLKELLGKMIDDEVKLAALEQGMEELNQGRQDIHDLMKREEDLKKSTEEAIRRKLEELKRRQGDLNRKAQAEKGDIQPRLDDRQAGAVPENEMKKALEAMEEDRLAEAVAQQQKAEDQMRKQAVALEKPTPRQPAAMQQARKMDEMADEQEAIRRELAQIAGIPQPDKRLEEVRRKQEELKKRAEALQRQADPQVNRERPRGDQAPQEMQRALDEMDRQAPQNAPEHQERAAGELDELAGNLEEQPEAAEPQAGQPEPAGRQLAQEARQLAREQRELKKELEDALPQAMQQLAEQQKAIEQDTREVAGQMEELAGALEQVMPEAAALGQKAQEAMKRAPEHMQKAAQDLEAAQGQEAAGQEQQAIDALAQAAEELGKLGQQLAQAAEEMGGQPEAGPPMPGMDMAKALAGMEKAGEMLRAMEQQQGTEAMRQAAQSLARAAQRMMRGLPDRQRAQLGNAEGIRGLAAKPDEIREVRKLELTAEEWNRLPGELKQKLLQAMKGKYPEEYRQLIRDYFSRLAKTGVKLDREER